MFPLHALLTHVQEGYGWLEKCLAESLMCGEHPVCIFVISGTLSSVTECMG